VVVAVEAAALLAQWAGRQLGLESRQLHAALPGWWHSCCCRCWQGWILLKQVQGYGTRGDCYNSGEVMRRWQWCGAVVLARAGLLQAAHRLAAEWHCWHLQTCMHGRGAQLHMAAVAGLAGGGRHLQNLMGKYSNNIIVGRTFFKCTARRLCMPMHAYHLGAGWSRAGMDCFFVVRRYLPGMQCKGMVLRSSLITSALRLIGSKGA